MAYFSYLKSCPLKCIHNDVFLFQLINFLLKHNLWLICICNMYNLFRFTCSSINHVHGLRFYTIQTVGLERLYLNFVQVRRQVWHVVEGYGRELDWRGRDDNIRKVSALLQIRSGYVLQSNVTTFNYAKMSYLKWLFLWFSYLVTQLVCNQNNFHLMFYVPMLRPISPEFVLFPDFWVWNIPQYTSVLLISLC